MRAGSGRKPTKPQVTTKPVAVTVPMELVDQLDGYRAKRNLNRSQAITEAIRGMLDAKSGR